jgi:hypothetical protein
VIDCEALSKTVQGDRELAALIKAAPQLDVTVLTSALTRLEAWNPRRAAPQAQWNWTLSRIQVVHTDDEVISTARTMMKSAGMHGHKYAIDAVLAAIAGREDERGFEVIVFTSGIDDKSKLLADRLVQVERV